MAADPSLRQARPSCAVLHRLPDQVSTRYGLLQACCLASYPAHPVCRQMRVQHLKKKADSELKAGNHRSAWDLYQQALQDAQDRDTRLALYSNLALALTRAGRTQEARSLAPHAWHAYAGQAQALLSNLVLALPRRGMVEDRGGKACRATCAWPACLACTEPGRAACLHLGIATGMFWPARVQLSGKPHTFHAMTLAHTRRPSQLPLRL